MKCLSECEMSHCVTQTESDRTGRAGAEARSAEERAAWSERGADDRTIARGPRAYASPETAVYCTQISTLARVDDALELPLLRASVSAFCEGDHG